MSEVTWGHEIEIEIGHSIDLGSLLINYVTAGLQIESEVQMSKNGSPTSFSILWPAVAKLIMNNPSAILNYITPQTHTPVSAFHA